MSPSVFLNPSAAQWVFRTPQYNNQGAILSFHKSLPEYNETPLHALPEVAKELGLSHVLVKDESNRFGLPAFKILGASWAVYRAVCSALGIAPGIGLIELGLEAGDKGITLVTSTEGNCGRAIARMAKLLDIHIKVFVPKYMDEATREKIRSEGAEVVEVQGSYDDTIPVIRREAEKEGVVLVLDVGLWDFEEVPSYFVEGYSTMMAEIDLQVLEVTGGKVATHAIVPCGADSIAQAVTQHFKGSDRKARGGTAKVIAVEETRAACLRASLEVGKSTSVSTGDTIMCGMNCGTLSSLAWPILEHGVDASVIVTDAESHAAVQYLKGKGVMAGPCGAAALAALRRVCTDAKEELGLGPESVVVLCSTEGPRDYVIPV